MIDAQDAALAIGAMAAVVYATRALGVLVAGRIGNNPRFRRLIETLPGCAMAALLAPAALHATTVELAALALASAIYWQSGRVLLASLTGIAVLVAGSWFAA